QSLSTPHRPPTPTLFPYTTLFRSVMCPAPVHRPTGDDRVVLHQHAVVEHGHPGGIPPRAVGREVRAVKHDVVRLPLAGRDIVFRSEEHTSELQSRFDVVCRLLLEK